jgi:diguanylate cyclase (GGDEF)-like protein/PAS domain S-box-containing protein
MNSGIRRHLHRKLAKSVFWTALLFALLSSSVFLLAEHRRVEQKNRSMLGQLLDTVENTAAIAAYSGNREIGRDVLNGLLRNDIVCEAALYNGAGLALRVSRGKAAAFAHEIVRELHSPFGEEIPIGRLVVVPEDGYDWRELSYGALYNILYASLLIGMTATLVLALVRASLSRPLANMCNRLHAITAGKEERLNIPPRHGDDELGRLVSDINGLLDALENKFAAEHAMRWEIESIEEQLRRLFETTSAGIFALDEGGALLTANPALARTLDLSELELAEISPGDFLRCAFAAPEQVLELIRRAKQSPKTVCQDLKLKGADEGPGAWVHCQLSRQSGNAGHVHYEGVVYDVTERRHAERRVKHEADHDALTGLLSRRAALRGLERMLEAEPAAGRSHVLLLSDLDDFKIVNDAHGHDAGDRVLLECARRLTGCVRAIDIVARLGGDEFLVGLNDIAHERARDIARSMVRAIRAPIPLDERLSVQVGVSIGIVRLDHGRHTLDELVKRADHAMYEVKRSGKNGFCDIGDDGECLMEEMIEDGEDESIT